MPRRCPCCAKLRDGDIPEGRVLQIRIKSCFLAKFNKTLVEASTTMLAFDKKLHTVKQDETDTRQPVLWLK